MEGILHSNSVHSQILFNTTYLNIYVDEKHDSSVIIHYVRQDQDEMQIRKNVTVTSLFVTLSRVSLKKKPISERELHLNARASTP